MIPVLLDENVSLCTASRLREEGYPVTAIAELAERGIRDEDVFAMAKEKKALLVTRDYHFTNPLRFPTSMVPGILFLADGNLKAAEETRLIQSFLADHPLNSFEGRLVILSPQGFRIR